MNVSEPLFSDVRYCVRCCFPETEEGTSYDETGICRVCQSSEQKMHINWAEREERLRRILDSAKANSGNNYDCILPISGGKDSMFQAHVLINIYGMKPLAVTFNHNWYSETGWYNLMNLLETFNIDHMMFTPSRDLVNRLAKRSLQKIGDTCWSCHSGCGSYPLQVAAKFNIPLIVYGESVAENSGRATYKEPLKFDREYFLKVSAKKSPYEMAGDGISEKDVYPFQIPAAEECESSGVKGIHLGDYMFWDSERQTEFVRDVYGWKETDIENSYKHYKSAECIMPGMHDFTCYLKRGFGRATTEGAIDVRNGLLTRSEAFDLIKQTDPVRPQALDYFLDKSKMSEDEFYGVMEGHRMKPLKNLEIPVVQKTAPHRERLVPYPVQLIERIKAQSKQKPFYVICPRSAAPSRSPAVAKSDLFLKKSVKQLVQDIQRGYLSPVDLAQVCIDQVQNHDETYRAMEVFDPQKLIDCALQTEARLAAGDPVRVLEGIPVGIKDIYNTRDFPTQMGSSQWQGFTPGNDARVVFNVKQAGGIVAGKTVTAELAVHALGVTQNPHDVLHTPGTSSSGAAVSCALGMMPVSLGSQTAGSISRPASFCGVYGFKPSFGTLPRTGTLKTTDSLDTLGFFVTHAEDIELVWDVVRVRGQNYPVSDSAFNDQARQAVPADRPWRVALLRTHTWEDASDSAQTRYLDWMNSIACDNNIEVVEIPVPDIVNCAHEIHTTIYDYALAYYFKEEASRQEEISELMAECIQRGVGISSRQYVQALKDQERLIAVVDEYMTGFDTGVSLSTASEAPLRQVPELRDPSLIWTLAHLPALNAPVFTSDTGLPFGVQLVARKYSDPLLLKFVRYLSEEGYIPPAVHPLVPDLVESSLKHAQPMH